MAASNRLSSPSPLTKCRRTYEVDEVKQPEVLFSRDGPLGARADVKVVTSDGQTLWLHRVVLEMWSALFQDLIAASEEHMESFNLKSSGGQVISITVSDTAADLMLLLSCLYPAAHHPHRRQGSTLDAASLLPLLGLADKYHCPHIIQRSAAFALDHVLPRLTTCTAPDQAAEYLQLPPQSPALGGEPASDVVDWMVRCVELAARLELNDVVEGTAALLGQRFFEWDLQADAHRDLLIRITAVLPPDLLVDLVLRAIPAPNAAAGGGPPGGAGKARSSTTGRHNSVHNSGGGGRQGAEAGAVAGVGAGGPRIVPVVVAAAGPAAAVAAQGGAAGAAAAAPQLAGPAPVQPAAVPHPAAAPQPFLQPQDQHHQPEQFANGFWPAGPLALMPLHLQGGIGGGHVQPEPLLGPAAW